MNYNTKKELNDLCYQIIGAAIEVQRFLGPGLLESIYEKCMIVELEGRGLKVKNQVVIPLEYKGKMLEADLRLDLLVEDVVVVELKTVENFLPIHEAQIISYLNLLGLPKGLLLNFKSTNIMKEGQKTFVTKEFYYLEDGY
ncbi:MAG: GxxExxY protein [Paludibacteraceae bacterium]